MKKGERERAHLAASTQTLLQHVQGSELDVTETLGLSLHIVDDLDRHELFTTTKPNEVSEQAERKAGGKSTDLETSEEARDLSFSDVEREVSNESGPGSLGRERKLLSRRSTYRGKKERVKRVREMRRWS